MGAGTVMLIVLGICVSLLAIIWKRYQDDEDYFSKKRAKDLAAATVVMGGAIILMLFVFCSIASQDIKDGVMKKGEVATAIAAITSPKSSCQMKYNLIEKLKKHNQALKNIKYRNDGFLDIFLSDEDAKRKPVPLDELKKLCKPTER